LQDSINGWVLSFLVRSDEKHVPGALSIFSIHSLLCY
jgi:hypothetical protein